ncbi:MAG TPA: serine/threonine-protein kinase [Candidatus Polarisedimenticolia bacterium]|nr:serine/threonine-protein kinase [Candidatus Polarisedimenticolia bacterium]
MGFPRTIGRYVIESELGRGSMGVVYKAHDPRIGRTVALKVLAFSFPLGPGEEEEFLRRFFDEAKIAGRLNHPNIVTIFDVGEKAAEGESYIAMEYVTGTNLHDLLASGGRLPIMQVVDVIEQAARALDYAHGNGVVHRDIKPANILLTDMGQVKILDFGIARLVSSSRTGPGRLFGTPNYMAPEQVTGAEVDGSADQFALGVTLYQLLTGERPFLGDSITAISYQVMNVDPAPPSKLNPTLSPSFDRILRRTLAKGSNDRYPSCADLADDLRGAANAWKDGVESTAPPTVISRRSPGDSSGADRPPGGLLGPGGPRGGSLGFTTPAGSPLSFGWIVFILCLALLASAPYFFHRAPDIEADALAATPNPIGVPGSARAASISGSDWSAPGATGTEEAATLRLSLRHRFTAGHIYVRLDGEPIVESPLQGDGSKSRWVHDLTVSAGHHRIEVRLTNAEKSIDDIEGVDVDFLPDEQKQLELSLGGLSKRLKMEFGAFEEEESE